MERYETSVQHDAWYEHWHRYHFIKQLVNNKKVCDIACGEGYGSALLASYARSVTGVDIDANTVKKARDKYGEYNNLSYIQSDALETCFKDSTFDVVVSLETLEHLKEHTQLLAEFSRILKDDGILIISTPDKDIYSPNNNDHNKYHVKELTKKEFDVLITTKFKYTQTFGQQFQLMSVIENHNITGSVLNNQCVYVESGDEFKAVSNQSEATYLIKICANKLQALEQLPKIDWHVFSDATNSLYQHHQQQLQRLIKIDEQNHEYKSIIDRQNTIIRHLKARLGL